jgi:hypothetical protein
MRYVATTSRRFLFIRTRFASSPRTYRGAASFSKGMEAFGRIVKDIEVIRLVVDGEHCVALLTIDTVFGTIPFAEHIHVVNGEIVSIRGYCDPRPMLEGAKASA